MYAGPESFEKLETNTNEDTLALKIDVGDCEFVGKRHDSLLSD